MNFNKFLQSLFGNKSSKDMKLIQPLVEKVKEAYPEIKALSNDELRARTKQLQKYVQDSANEEKAKIAELKAKIEDTPIDERESIFNAIDKLEKEVLEIYEKALNEVMPVAFSIVKDTARRFAENEETVVTATDFDRELAANPKNDFITIDGDKAIYHNHWTAGGNDLKWEMIHYDVQLFGGTVLHQGKIAEMATGEGKTLVSTLPVFLNALTDSLSTVLTSTVLTRQSAARLTWQTSHSVRTMSSASTTFATTWLSRLPTSCSASTTMPLSMRSTQCLSTTHVLRLSSLDLLQRATTRCSRSTSRL